MMTATIDSPDTQVAPTGDKHRDTLSRSMLDDVHALNAAADAMAKPEGEIDAEIAKVTSRLDAINSVLSAMQNTLNNADARVARAAADLRDAERVRDQEFERLATKAGFPNAIYIQDRQSVKPSEDLRAAEAACKEAHAAHSLAEGMREIVRGMIPQYTLRSIEGCRDDLIQHRNTLVRLKQIMLLPKSIRDQIASRLTHLPR